MEATGSFVVSLNPVDVFTQGQDSLKPGRMTIEKTFSGALNATSTGEMLSLMTGTQGSAGYVAIEVVEGELQGKTGSFALQHFGTMDKGKDQLILKVVPDSGSGELAGLTGDMKIIIHNGQHDYVFTYSL